MAILPNHLPLLLCLLGFLSLPLSGAASIHDLLRKHDLPAGLLPKDLKYFTLSDAFSRARFDRSTSLMPVTRSGQSYNSMEQGSHNPNTNLTQTSVNLQQQLDQLSQMLNTIIHRLEVIEERSNNEEVRGPRGKQWHPQRKEGIGESDGEEEEVQLGGVRRRETDFLRHNSICQTPEEII